MSPTIETLSAQFGQLVVVPPPAPAPAPAPAPVTATAPAPVPGAVATATPAPVAPAPVAPGPIQATSHAAKGYDLDVTVPSHEVVAAALILDHDGFSLDAVTGVDWLAQDQMEVVYDYFHPTAPLRVVVRTRLPRANPELPTIGPVFPGATWHERETHDFFGIRFSGHPNLKPFLLPEDANFHPLRKDYQP